MRVRKETLRCADDQVIIYNSEVNLAREVIKLQCVAKMFVMEISPEKSQAMAFLLGQDRVRCKIVVDNKCL